MLGRGFFRPRVEYLDQNSFPSLPANDFSARSQIPDVHNPAVASNAADGSAADLSNLGRNETGVKKAHHRGSAS
jgi:hypothetical protein